AVDLELVVIKSVELVPESRAAQGIHGVGDGDKVLEELGSDVLITRVFLGELQGHCQHGGAVKGHPGGAIGLLQMAAGRQRLGAIEDADVVQTQESAGEKMFALDVLAIDPPGEINQKFLKNAGQEKAIALASRPGHL